MKRGASKKALVAKLMEVTGKEKAEVDSLLAIVISAIESLSKETGSVAFGQLGRFYLRNRKSRQGRNPKTGAPMTVEARQVLTFKAKK